MAIDVLEGGSSFTELALLGSPWLIPRVLHQLIKEQHNFAHLRAFAYAIYSGSPAPHLFFNLIFA